MAKITAEERLLWDKYCKDRSIINRNVLVEHYDRFVWKIASNTAKTTGQDVKDLHQMGFFGLIQAIERFDITKNDSFCGYAAIRVKGSMIDNLRQENKTRAVQKYNIHFYSLENSICTNDDGDYDLGCNDILLDNSEEENISLIDVEDFLDHLCRHMQDREKKIAKMRVIEGHTFAYIARQMDICESRINQLWNHNILPILKENFLITEF